ncbi:MAG: ATP synthase F1 subunit epsilon [Candidatus Nomurabacteria bacterium]|jgi:F-type H+-transporting ATPase subunit epsilon|nr:ATP synthase F1 subunit epsilon [Candidatus Nomurabacteria bacterium]
MKLQLVTPIGLKRDEEVYEVILPTMDGEIGVLPGHEPLVTLLDVGIMSVRAQKNDSDEAMEHFAVSTGIAEIDGSRVLILADEADEGDDIAEQEAKAALERAQKMRAEASDQVAITEAEKLLKRHTTQLKVAELRRHHRKSRLTWNANNMKRAKQVDELDKKDDSKT